MVRDKEKQWDVMDEDEEMDVMSDPENKSYFLLSSQLLFGMCVFVLVCM